jgi:hypothetical protein
MSRKVFGIGLSRTGTTSLTFALSQLGLHAHHFPRSQEVIELADAVTDTPVAASFRQLDAEYPGSKFILTLRDLASWLDSCETLWQSSVHLFDEFTARIHRQLYGREDFDRPTFSEAYARHRNDVLLHFAGREQFLLCMDICAGDGWAPLCGFLGFDHPPLPFPHRNARAALGHDWVTDCPPRTQSPDE